ncbi:MAG TPA: flagellar biosynthetic protein FliR [Kineosporiaceae bacterium]
MTGLQLTVGESTLASFLLAVARTVGFVLVTPPFSTRSVPTQARVGAALALALPVAGLLRTSAPALDSGALLVGIVLQAATGLALGFLVMAAVSAIQAAGDLLDAVGGFSVSMALDPLLLAQTSVLGRLHQITALTLLFVTDGHLMIVHGLTRSVALMPAGMTTWGEAARSASAAVGTLMLGALQIAAPVVAAMLATDIALGLLTRAAPALNAFALSYPLKILITLLLTGLVIARLPGSLEALVRAEVLQVLRLVAPPGGR